MMSTTQTSKIFPDNKPLTAKTFKGVRDKLLSLHDIKIQHVFLRGHDDILSNHLDVPPILLTSDRRAIVRYLDAKIPIGHSQNATYHTIDSPTLESGDFWIRIAETGKNFLPSRFEGDVLARRILASDSIYTPDQEHAFWCELYLLAVHEGRFTDQEFGKIGPRLVQKMGMILKCKYHDVEHKVKS